MHAALENRCTFTTRDRRRCRNLCAADHASLCLPHLRQAHREEGRLPPAPASPFATDANLDSPRAIRRAVKRAMRAFAASEITAQQAHALLQFLRVLLSCSQPQRRPTP